MIEVGGIYKLKKIKDFFGTNTEDDFKVLKISGDTVYCQNEQTKELNMFDKKFFIDPEFPDDIYSDFQIVWEKLDKAMKPMNLSFWKELQEDAMASTAAAVSALSGGGPTGPAPTATTGGARVNGVPVMGKSIMSLINKKTKKKKKKNEELQLVWPADDELQIGDTYFAQTEDDVFACLDKMTLADATGVYLKNKYGDTCELTIELIEPDQYILKLEQDDNANDWDGKDVMNTDLITKEEVIQTLQSLFKDYRVITNKVDESIENFIKELTEDFNEEYETITELLAKQLDRMNFIFANTEDIVYKKEGAYKYLIKFDNENGFLKFKISKDDNTIEYKEWKLGEGDDISPIFEEIEELYRQYGI
jgi:hypothetical protein